MSDEIKTLIGKTLADCTGEINGDEIRFRVSGVETYKLYHSQDCCESVRIKDIDGDLSDLVGSPIIQAECVTSKDNPPSLVIPSYQDSFLWTFYRITSAKGQVVISWYGESNGYYSESVEFKRCDNVTGE